MLMVSLNAAVFVITALAYVGLLLHILRRDEPLGAERWMAAYCLWSVFAAGAMNLSAEGITLLGLASGFWLALTSLVGICLLGGLTFRYLEMRGALTWLAAALPLSAVMLWADRLDPTPGLAELSWRAALFQPSEWLPAISAATWVLIAFALLTVSFRSVMDARLPLHANRFWWWLLALLLIIGGQAAATWGADFAAGLGQGVHLIGVAAAVYATTTQELIDIRGIVRSVVGDALYVAATALIIALAIALSLFVVVQLPDTRGLIGALAVIFAVALFYQRIRAWLSKIVQRVVLAAGYDTALIAANYSQRVANILDIGDLTITAGITLAQSVEPDRVGLLLLTPTESNTRAEVIMGAGRLPTTPHNFGKASPFLKALKSERRPLSQFRIDYHPQFRSLAKAERRWLQALGLDMYVPIFDGELLSAILAVGSRRSGDPYRARDLGLLSAIADQTSVALKNARLVTNLRRLNEQMRALNQDMASLNAELAASNERLKQLDRVKSDFINIASHELRTPLTTIRGYADILSEGYAERTLPQEQIDRITAQLIRACNRLEEVISQVLDVSQLDVEAMPLSFSPTSVDATLRLAAESLAAAIAERRQHLSIQGTQDLPPLAGDFQRLVQAFRQIISNAIKFTPDGGRIDIYAHYLPANEDRQRPEAVEVVIADTGTGIDPAHHELIFEKFYRVGRVDLHSTGATKFMGAGPGLGLTVAQGVIKRHGGHIWVESPGFDLETFPGSQFHVVLPVRPIPLNGRAATTGG